MEDKTIDVLNTQNYTISVSSAFSTFADGSSGNVVYYSIKNKTSSVINLTISDCFLINLNGEQIFPTSTLNGYDFDLGSVFANCSRKGSKIFDSNICSYINDGFKFCITVEDSSNDYLITYVFIKKNNGWVLKTYRYKFTNFALNRRKREHLLENTEIDTESFELYNFKLNSLNYVITADSEINLLLEISSGEVENLSICRFLTINLYNSNDTIIATHIDSIKYNQNNTYFFILFTAFEYNGFSFSDLNKVKIFINN